MGDQGIPVESIPLVTGRNFMAQRNLYLKLLAHQCDWRKFDRRAKAGKVSGSRIYSIARTLLFGIEIMATRTTRKKL